MRVQVYQATGEHAEAVLLELGWLLALEARDYTQVKPAPASGPDPLGSTRFPHPCAFQGLQQWYMFALQCCLPSFHLLT